VGYIQCEISNLIKENFDMTRYSKYFKPFFDTIQCLVIET